MSTEGSRVAAGLPDTHAGYLEKKGKLKNGTWKRRYFALRGHHLLCFADNDPDRPVLASIDVVKVEVCGPDANDTASIFNLKVLEGSIKLRAPDAGAREKWERVLVEAQNGAREETRRSRSVERRKQIMEIYMDRKEQSSSSIGADAEDGATSVPPAPAPALSRAGAPGGAAATEAAAAPGPRKYRVNTEKNGMLSMLATAGYVSSVRHTVATQATKEGAAPARERPSSPDASRASSLVRSMSLSKQRFATTQATQATKEGAAPARERPSSLDSSRASSLVRSMSLSKQRFATTQVTTKEGAAVGRERPSSPDSSSGRASSLARSKSLSKPRFAPTQVTTKEGAAVGRERPSSPDSSSSSSGRASSLVRSMSLTKQSRWRRSLMTPTRSTDQAWAWGEREAEKWIASTIGAKRPPECRDLWAWLRDGTVLCELANALKPGVIRKVHRNTKLPFKQMENISHFLTACRDEFGVEPSSLFESLDLYDRKGPQQVLFCLNALRKESETADRDRGRRNSKGNRALPSMFSRKPTTVDVDPTYVPTHQTAAASQNQDGATSITSDGYATVVAEHDANDADELTVFIGDVVNVKLARGGWCFAEENEGWVLVQKGGEQGLVPASCLKAGTTDESYFKAGGGRGSSALDKELAAKAAAKYDPIAEALAQHWIEQVTGHVFRKPFADELKDGVLLCRLVNEIKPGSVAKIYRGAKAFGQMDNISAFLKAVKRLGVLSRDTFETTDLFEMRDLNLVVQCLFALSKAIVKSDWTGPFLTGHDAGFNEAVMSNLKVIIGVGEYRDRHRHFQKIASDDDDDDVPEDVVGEAVEYRLAMLGLRDTQVAGANVHGVDRAKMEPSYLVVWSSSTKSTLAMETNERRLLQLLAAKKKRYEMVYVDVSPERKIELNLICGDKEVELPALTFGADYRGPFEKIQELEDDGLFDDLIKQAPDGEGFWALPEAWGVQSSMLEGGGMQIVNEVPAL
ncbi:hypothetical protein CTAYLR_008483 [Chrysophaeum taylorii]|uniref:Uncharacterized protein n=1 Tax=Chrysophaeum taylorii TaxID=2483200 RepID=A0AAD7UB68_9STRA|nr:hypothetical protein CTAYLR_008483 [Chrysophaeum taylorii]